MEELNEKQRKEKVQQALRNYIKEHKKNSTYIKSKSQIYRDLGKETYGISQATFYRYMDEMHCKRRTDGRYDFTEEDSAYLTEFLEQRFYTNRMYFYVNEPLLGSYLSSKINSYYEDYKKVFHCVVVQDLLICFYKKRKDRKDGSSNGGLTSREIQKDIQHLLEQYMILYKTNEFPPEN